MNERYFLESLDEVFQDVKGSDDIKYEIKQRLNKRKTCFRCDGDRDYVFYYEGNKTNKALSICDDCFDLL